MVDRLGPELAEPVFDRVAIVGVGLIGSSIARAARRIRAAGAIVLADASSEVLERAKALNLGTEYAPTAFAAARGADVVIFCAPVGANEAIAKEVGPALKPGAIVSDVGSVKSAVIAAIAP